MANFRYHSINGTRGRGRNNINRDEYLETAHQYAKRGTGLKHTKATPELVNRIRDNKHGWPRRKWAELTGLHIRTIDKIAEYKTWKHV